MTLLAGAGLAAGQDQPAPPRPGNEPPAQPRRLSPDFRDERAEKILDEAIEAMGGREAIAGRSTIFLKKKITNFDYPDPVEGTLTYWFKRPSQLRREIAYPQKTQTVVLDGEKAWLDDGEGPKLLSSMMAKMIARGMRELDTPLMYLEGGLRYLSIAKDPRGRLTQKLSWRHEGYARDLMIDVATSRVLVIGEFDTPAGAISRMKVYDDYRPVQGLFIPYKEVVFRNDQKYTESEVLEVKFDEPIEDALFEFPGLQASN